VNVDGAMATPADEPQPEADDVDSAEEPGSPAEVTVIEGEYSSTSAFIPLYIFESAFQRNHTIRNVSKSAACCSTVAKQSR
jgi:hypothetical protein